MEERNQICQPETAQPPRQNPIPPEETAPPAQDKAQLEQELASLREEKTERLEQELSALREEKRRRSLLEECRALLEERGIDPRFAEFIQGEDRAAIRKKAERFERQFNESLRLRLAQQLPRTEPRDFSASRPASRRRGIRPVRGVQPRPSGKV